MNKKLLGVDYGRRNMGLAVSETTFAEPRGTLSVKNLDIALEKINKLVQDEKFDEIIVGVSEGKMAAETREFIKKLKKKVVIPVTESDETLSSKEAQQKSIQAGVKRKRRKLLTHAYSATVILQKYLDSVAS